MSQRYVALGDSQTEGLIDPDGRGGLRGWADRFADHLTVREPHLQYANLAVRGLRVGEIRAGQLDAALALRPDLATVMGGMNDILRPSFELSTVLNDLDAMFLALRESGAVVLTNTFPDIAQIAPLIRGLGPRVNALNDGIRAVAAHRGARVVDFALHGAGTDSRIWNPDRIHANAVGHSLIAAAFADTFGLPGFASWADPLPEGVPGGRARRMGTEARWVAGSVLPWATRRLRGRSSADGRSARRLRLVPVAALFHLVAPGDWPAAGQYAPTSLNAEGFVHFSFADQVEASANRHYADAENLIAVEIDPARIEVPIRVEDSYGSGTSFPHGYGPVPIAAATAIHPLRRNDDGVWTFLTPAENVQSCWRNR